jgi:hypothetical protein
MALWEVRWEVVQGAPEPAAQMVMRLIAPQIGAEDGPGFEAALADMDWLCETHAAPLAALPYAQGETVIVNLMDRPLPRGATDPDAVQYFQTYRIADGTCEAEDLL